MKYQLGQTFIERRNYGLNGEIVQRSETVEVLGSRISAGMFKFGKNQVVYSIKRTVRVADLQPIITEEEISENNLSTFVERYAEEAI